MANLLLELLQVSLGTHDMLTRIPSEAEWVTVLTEAQRQAIVGVLTQGIERLPEDQKPPKENLLQWIGFAFQIESTNRHLNTRCLELQKLFEENGFRSCILKGQGNALLYPKPLLRQSGDIDIWVKPEEGKWIKGTVDYLGTKCDILKQSICYHHVEFPFWNDVEIEVHWRPSWKSSPVHNRRLQRWFKTQSSCQLDHIDKASGLHIPTKEFNLVYLLQHMFLHIFQEGLGMRQVIDYYYLLTSDERACDYNIEGTLRYLDLYHFAGAIMYVLREALGMEETYQIVPVDKRRGMFLLDEIMRSGNFGQYDERNRKLAQKTGISRSLARLKRQYRFIRDYPVEVLCAPFLIYHVIWRKLKLWKLE